MVINPTLSLLGKMLGFFHWNVVCVSARGKFCVLNDLLIRCEMNFCLCSTLDQGIQDKTGKSQLKRSSMNETKVGDEYFEGRTHLFKKANNALSVRIMS